VRPGGRQSGIELDPPGDRTDRSRAYAGGADPCPRTSGRSSTPPATTLSREVTAPAIDVSTPWLTTSPQRIETPGTIEIEVGFAHIEHARDEFDFARQRIAQPGIALACADGGQRLVAVGRVFRRDAAFLQPRGVAAIKRQGAG